MALTLGPKRRPSRALANSRRRPTISNGRSTTASKRGRATSDRLRLLARNRIILVGRMRWTSSSFLLIGIALLLTMVGLTFIASASSVSSLHKSGDSWVEFHQQLVFGAIGLVFMLVSAVVPYRIWWRLGPWIFAGSFAATLYAAFFGVMKNGSRRWIPVGPFELQPSEAMKFTAVVFFAMVFTRRTTLQKMNTTRFLFRTLLLVVALAIGPILKQPDMGTASIVLFSCVAIVIVAGLHMKRLMPFGVGLLGLGFLYAMSAQYRRDRVMVFFDPERDPTGKGFHITQSKLGFATGRLFGVGIGASRSKWGWVPNAHTDFIFAVIGEEIGLVGATTVLALFIAIAFIGFSVVNHAPDRFGALLAAGITTWIISQAAVNMGTVLGLVPVTGVPLPFVSSGGSSYVILGVGFGVLVNIARAASVRDVAELSPVRVARNARLRPSGNV